MESHLEVLVKSAQQLQSKSSRKLDPFVSIRLRGKKAHVSMCSVVHQLISFGHGVVSL